MFDKDLVWDLYQEAGMFEKENIGILNHCAGVAHVAGHLARRLNEHGMKIDVNSDETAGWLHDIGKVLDGSLWGHVDKGVEFLERQKVPKEIIDLVAKHQYWGESVSAKGLSLEEKIIILADLSFSDRIISSYERAEDIIARYAGNGISLKQAKQLKKLSREISLEIFQIIMPQTLLS